jgi:hypothetical protein
MSQWQREYLDRQVTHWFHVFLESSSFRVLISITSSWYNDKSSTEMKSSQIDRLIPLSKVIPSWVWLISYKLISGDLLVFCTAGLEVLPLYKGYFVVLTAAKFWANSVHITSHFHFRTYKESHGTTELNSRETETQITRTTCDAVNLHIITSSEEQISPCNPN